jgi:hypothetical protein
MLGTPSSVSRTRRKLKRNERAPPRGLGGRPEPFFLKKTQKPEEGGRTFFCGRYCVCNLTGGGRWGGCSGMASGTTHRWHASSERRWMEEHRPTVAAAPAAKAHIPNFRGQSSQLAWYLLCIITYSPAQVRITLKEFLASGQKHTKKSRRHHREDAVTGCGLDGV